MPSKLLAARALLTASVLAAWLHAPAVLRAQSDQEPATTRKGATSYTYPVPAAAPAAVPGSGKPDCNGGPCEEQQPRVIVTLPAPAPTPWPWHDRILWAAYLVLAFVGYAGIMMGRTTLKKIEEHSAAAEQTAVAAAAAAAAASEAAQAALAHSQAILHAERPWLTLSAEPTLGVENSFNVIATNRGRSPAVILSTLDQVLFAADEAHLPARPAWIMAETSTPPAPIILLPGEFVSVKAIRRDDARALCGTEDRWHSVESWAEKLYLCGKVRYNDLIAPAGKEFHETAWCCWYIHGRQKSGLVVAGPPEYHTHT
jgi:hypothetical protein